MITYKYKLYQTHRTKYLDKMLAEACFVWNHALALQKRYYKMYHKYIGICDMQKHHAKRIKRNHLGAQTVQVILQTLDIIEKIGRCLIKKVSSYGKKYIVYEGQCFWKFATIRQAREKAYERVNLSL